MLIMPDVWIMMCHNGSTLRLDVSGGRRKVVISWRKREKTSSYSSTGNREHSTNCFMTAAR